MLAVSLPMLEVSYEEKLCCTSCTNRMMDISHYENDARCFAMDIMSDTWYADNARRFT